jgi:hypothetical protein
VQPKLRLPGVTLIAVTSVDIDNTNAALSHCCQCAEFGAVKMLCSQPPRFRSPHVQYFPISPIDFLGYSRFMIQDLNNFVETEHCLVIQADGFILNPARWEPRFLKYDYIGAPWPEYVGLSGQGSYFRFGKNRVGNGGFSPRSKKLLDATARLRFDQLDLPIKSEDIVICHYCFDDLRSVGIRFAPSTLAARFSLETEGVQDATLNSVFGFHGKHWLPAVQRAYPWLRA